MGLCQIRVNTNNPIICDIEICFNFKWLFVMQLFISFEFYIKNIYLFYIYIHFDKI